MPNTTRHSKSPAKMRAHHDVVLHQRSHLTGAVDVNLPQSRALDEAVSVIPFIIKTIVVCGVIVGGYYFISSSYKNRFIKRKYRSDLDPSNISDAEADSRADAIYAALGWFSTDFDVVKANIANLNYNGFIKLYNAFGHRTGTLFGGELDLEQWCRNQFPDRINELSFLTNGAFFK